MADRFDAPRAGEQAASANAENSTANAADPNAADPNAADPKDRQLDAFRARPEESPLTTQQGVLVDDTDNSLRAGERGPTLLEDFQLREKITHFDHERIPERVVHARGTGAYGYFELSESLEEYTCADFLCQVGMRTPVFVRFSTVQGPRGSADTVRDVRGFATKFYTRHGNYDLVGNNMPVFFIQDAIKFPDFVHAVKPEPHREIPTGASAHDTFWDFCSLQTESTHMLMWAMSDRAIPRSLRMMQGFGVHTFRLVNADGVGTFVKFHWRPALGVASQVWDEALLTAGRDPDFHRRDLWDAIEAGQFPEWELGVQLVPEAQEFAFDFDLLDATKIIPEELVPVRPVGRMVLNRNPDNFFAETEQAAFHTANLVPGIDFSNDPLLQGRNFSYLDTQLIRLGGPNFAQLPVNRPVAAVSNNQRDGYGQHRVHPGRASYAPNSFGATEVAQPGTEQVYQHYQRRVDGDTIRRRSPSFADHYSQATLFWNSMSDWEKRHIVAAFAFELAHVESMAVRERMVANLMHVDRDLASQVAAKVGVRDQRAGERDRSDEQSGDEAEVLHQAAKHEAAQREAAEHGAAQHGATQHGATQHGAAQHGASSEQAAQAESGGVSQHSGIAGTGAGDVSGASGAEARKSPALSQQNLLSDRLDGRKVALMRAHGADKSRGFELREQLSARGVSTVVLVPERSDGVSVQDKYGDSPIPRPAAHDSSTFYDAVVLLGETDSWLAEDQDARRFVNEAYRHGKPIGALGRHEDAALGTLAAVVAKPEGGLREDAGIITQSDPESSTSAFTQRLLGALERHRFPEREVS